MSRRSLILLLVLLPLATGSAVIIALKDGSQSAHEGSLQETGAPPSATTSDLRSDPDPEAASSGASDESQPAGHPAIDDDAESSPPEPQEQRPATESHIESDDAFGAPMFASVAAETSNELIASQPDLGSPSTPASIYRLAGRSRGATYGGGMGGGGSSGSADSANDTASDSQATISLSDEGDDALADTQGSSSGAKSPSETASDETDSGDRTEPGDETEPQDEGDASDSQLAWQPPEHGGPSESQPGETSKSDTPQQEHAPPQDSPPNDDSTLPDYPGYTLDPIEPTPVQVPEPSSLALLALGLLGCGIRRKRGVK